MAAAFLAAALFPLFAGAQESGQASLADPSGKPQMGRPSLPDSLGLTAAQKKALEELRKSRATERQAFGEEMAKLRAEMRGLAKDPQTNQAGIDALIDRRAALRAGREKSALRARAERNKLFTPDQLEKLRRIAGRSRIGRPRDGRFLGPRAGLRPMARLRALRHRLMLRWRRW
jgi:Spy/CpxP family protein refolding chaperone